ARAVAVRAFRQLLFIRGVIDVALDGPPSYLEPPCYLDLRDALLKQFKGLRLPLGNRLPIPRQFLLRSDDAVAVNDEVRALDHGLELSDHLRHVGDGTADSLSDARLIPLPGFFILEQR